MKQNQTLRLLSAILEKCGVEDALQNLRNVHGFEKEKMQLAVAFAKEVRHLMPNEAKAALDVAERFANGLATTEELEKAQDAARAAVNACAGLADAYAARAAVNAANACADIADAVADAAVGAACAYSAAAYAAAGGAGAGDDADDDAYDAREAMEEKQTQILRNFLAGNSID